MTNKQMKNFVESLTDKQKERFLAELLASMPVMTIKQVVQQTAINESKNLAVNAFSELLDGLI